VTAAGTDDTLDNTVDGTVEGTVDVPEPRWGLPDVVVAFVAANIASMFGYVAYAAIRGIPLSSMTGDALSIGEVALLQVPLWLGLLGVPLLATRLRGNGPVTDLGWWATWRDCPIGLAIGVACQFVLVPLVTLPVLLLTDRDTEDLAQPARELTDKATGAGVVVLLLVVGVAAPIAEEVFFRGMLQRSLIRHLPLWPALVVTSLLFGASHFQALQFPALAAFGMVLSVIAHRTGRLGLNTWAHVGFNATTVVLLLAQR
jgi:membrane protease YdiL (CAAX protease family)